MQFSDVIKGITVAQFTFKDVRDWIVRMLTGVLEQLSWSSVVETIVQYKLFVALGLIGVGLIIAFFGQKKFLTGLLRFLLLFAVGYTAGAYYLAPIIPESINIQPWIVGLVIGAVAAVLYKYLYYLLLVVVVGYSIYALGYSGVVISALAENTIVCAAVAGVVVVVVLVLTKWVHRLLTAALGGYIIALAFNWGIYAYTSLSFLSGIEYVGILVVTAVIAIPAFIYQVAKRDIYF